MKYTITVHKDLKPVLEGLAAEAGLIPKDYVEELVIGRIKGAIVRGEMLKAKGEIVGDLDKKFPSKLKPKAKSTASLGVVG